MTFYRINNKHVKYFCHLDRLLLLLLSMRILFWHFESPWVRDCMQIHELACSYISLQAGPWACMQFPELTWCSMSSFLCSHKKYAVLVFCCSVYDGGCINLLKPLSHFILPPLCVSRREGCPLACLESWPTNWFWPARKFSSKEDY